jgi:hypothetical protein
MDKLSWIEKFNIDEEKIPKQGDHGLYGTALYRVLKRGMLKSEDYLHWAQDQYKMATLKDEFLNSPPQDFDNLWIKWEKALDWSPELMPIAEWDDVLFVAALEPMEHRPENIRIQPVLAHWHQIETLFKKVNPDYEKQKEVEHDLPDNFFDDESSITNNTKTSITRIQGDRPADFKTQVAKVAENVHKHEFKNLTTTAQTGFLAKAALHYFERLHEHYDFSVLLEPQGDSMRVTAWDPKISPLKDPTKVSIPLLTPSIFHIVKKTSKPFHGQVVNNKINQMFFSAFLQDPENVKFATVIPILSPRKDIDGMFVCYSEKPPELIESLKAAEKVGKKIILRANDSGRRKPKLRPA